MSQNGTTVYLSDENRHGVEAIQEEHSCGKSEAINQAIEAGLRHRNGGPFDSLYRDLSMICLTIGVAFAAMFYRGGLLMDSALFYSLLFISAAFLSLAADRYGLSVRRLVTKDTTAESAPRGG